MTTTQSGQTTTFINDSSGRTLIRIRSNETMTYYVYGAGLLYDVEMASLGVETATHTTHTYHFDIRGSTVALTDNSSHIIERMSYGPYGALASGTPSTDTPFLFNGRYGVMTDPNSLLYMRARYYNPYICRFINADPSGFGGGMNFYGYADGNPISKTDPFGLGTENKDIWSWVGNQALAGGKAGFGWSYDQVHGFGAILAAAGAGIIGDTIVNFGQGDLGDLGQRFQGWSQDLLLSRDQFARAGTTHIVRLCWRRLSEQFSSILRQLRRS